MITFQSIRNLKLATLFGLCCACPVAAQTVSLSLDDGRVAARNAALAGNFELARDFADALIDADPDDRAALIVLAAALPQLGEARDGRRAGARAYRLSTTSDQRYEAARLTALAAANEDRYTLSQFWLRRAAVHAPDDAAEAQTARDYRGIRNLNPLSANLQFSLTPSNNVNGGAEGDCLEIIGFVDQFGNPICGKLSGDAQALSGVAASADLRLSYAVLRAPAHRTSLTARAYARHVWLSDDAAEVAPTSRDSDFASQVFEIGVQHQRALEVGTLSAETLLGASWFGGTRTADYIRTRLGYQFALSERTSLAVNGQYDVIDLPQSVNQRTNYAHFVGATVAHVTEGGNRVTATVSFAGQSSENLNERYDSVTAQLGYAWANPVGPVRLSANGGLVWTDYDDYTIILPIPDGRQDTRAFASVTAVFHDMDYAGFVPTVTFGAQDTTSNVSRFDRNEYSLGIGLRSSF